MCHLKGLKDSYDIVFATSWLHVWYNEKVVGVSCDLAVQLSHNNFLFDSLKVVR